MSKKQPIAEHESPDEVLEAIGSMTGALTGKEIDDLQARQIVRELQTDQEAKTAINSISGAMEIQRSDVKYCPVDGQRFSSAVEECPDHKIKLKMLEE